MRNNLFTFVPWLPLLFHHAHWDQTEESLCRSLGPRPTLAQGSSALTPLLFGTTLHYLCVQPPWLPPSEEVSKHDLAFSPRRHRCAQRPVDVTEYLQRICIWTPVWLLRHRAWLRRGCWRYRNLIDWLMYDTICTVPCMIPFIQCRAWYHLYSAVYDIICTVPCMIPSCGAGSIFEENHIW